MERLTYERTRGNKTGYLSHAKKDVLIERLAAYENSDLEPGIIRDMMQNYQLLCKRMKLIEDNECKEWCQFCNTEVHILWDVKVHGYQIYCPNCGNRLMLCNKCTHSDDYRGCNWAEENGCCRHKKATQLQHVEEENNEAKV